MVKLINAEFRKIFTTKLWWALLIPALVLSLLWAWAASALTSGIADEVNRSTLFQQADISFEEVSWSVIALARGMNISSIFPMVFGALGMASELSRRTITTTFLTAPSRVSVLGAKAVTYLVWGVVFGVVISVGVSLGTLFGSDSNYLPNAADWMLTLVAGVLMCVLWTLVGLGFGALVGSPVGALVSLLVYALIIGPVLEVFLANSGAAGLEALAGLMPNGSANGLTSSTAAALLFDQIQTLVLDQGGVPASADVKENFDEVMRLAAGAPGAYSLWVSGLVFLGWTAIFFGTGMLRNKSRDIT
ncbi:putative ABC transport system membrane protein [Actinokineospora spheciospongiae]|uniref:Putative ABC transport system membrane protein n=1 Tax=Actinokineospora spheciospongiae TaxID=909613 RepID=W7J5U6_9PSEU|nr:ABC transporter permease subunit [Actinokineospora spheciospongiae]EWC61459.1 putative ABC transport system membrane protein [Actinokineospora spheciospongiae]